MAMLGRSISKDELKMLSSHCATNDWTAVNKGKSDSDLVGVIGLNLLLRQFLTVDSTPGVDDIGQHEGYEQRDVEHRGERELTGAGVLDGQRRLEVGGRGIVGRVVPC